MDVIKFQPRREKKLRCRILQRTAKKQSKDSINSSGLPLRRIFQEVGSHDLHTHWSGECTTELLCTRYCEQTKHGYRGHAIVSPDNGIEANYGHDWTYFVDSAPSNFKCIGSVPTFAQLERLSHIAPIILNESSAKHCVKVFPPSFPLDMTLMRRHCCYHSLRPFRSNLSRSVHKPGQSVSRCCCSFRADLSLILAFLQTLALCWMISIAWQTRLFYRTVTLSCLSFWLVLLRRLNSILVEHWHRCSRKFLSTLQNKLQCYDIVVRSRHL